MIKYFGNKDSSKWKASGWVSLSSRSFGFGCSTYRTWNDKLHSLSLDISVLFFELYIEIWKWS